MIFINSNSKLSIIDNSGVSKFRVIGFSRFAKGQIGDLCIGSLSRVRPRRRLKKGQIFRSLIIQSRLPVFRQYGAYLRSLATRSILVKRNELIPVANRLNSFYFLELKKFEAFKLSAITVYVILFFNMVLNYKTLNSFSKYAIIENAQLRHSASNNFSSSEMVVGGVSSASFGVRRTFFASAYFDFIRFFHLVFSIVPTIKPFIFQNKTNFVFQQVFKSKFFFLLLIKLYYFSLSSKSGFMSIRFFDNGTGFINIQEPHVAFAVNSPYFDYHNSKISLKLCFSYKKNPVFVYKLLWLFGLLKSVALIINCGCIIINIWLE